jgi:transcription-repair coupling factor (superfamily II helicase)
MWPDLQRALDRSAVIAYGATPGWAAWLAAQLASREPLVVVVTPDDAAARELESDVRFFIGGERDATELDAIASLPGIDVSPYADLSPDRSCIVERVATLYRLTQPDLRPRMVITSAEALTRRTIAPQELATRGLTIKQGDTIDRDSVAALLVAGGWARTFTRTVEDPPFRSPTSAR